MCFRIRRRIGAPSDTHGYKIVRLLEGYNNQNLPKIAMGTPLFVSAINYSPDVRWTLGGTVRRNPESHTREPNGYKGKVQTFLSVAGIYVWTKSGMARGDHFENRRSRTEFILPPGYALVEVEVKPSEFIHESVARGVRTYESAKMTKVLAYCPYYSRALQWDNAGNRTMSKHPITERRRAKRVSLALCR